LRAARQKGILSADAESRTNPMGYPCSLPVPRPLQPTYDAVVALTDVFCSDRLDDEYRDLARAMTAALCRKRPSPLASGKTRSWSCSIIYLLGQINFLSDRASQPFMTMADVCAAFGVGQSTACAKARVISRALHAHRTEPRWMLRAVIERNPRVWFAEVKGFLVDLRDMPREAQVIAYNKGIIPYVPADQKGVDEAPSEGRYATSKMASGGG
jgi:Domain of unknown function (DUF6398)